MNRIWIKLGIKDLFLSSQVAVIGDFSCGGLSKSHCLHKPPNRRDFNEPTAAEQVLQFCTSSGVRAINAVEFL